LVQPFPTEYFRHEILVDINLLIAGSYLLLQGLFYAELFFIGTERSVIEPLDIWKNPVWQLYLFCNTIFMIHKTFQEASVEQATFATEESQMLLSET